MAEPITRPNIASEFTDSGRDSVWDREGILIRDFGENRVAESVNEAKNLLATQYQGRHVALQVRRNETSDSLFFVSIDELGVVFGTYSGSKEPFRWGRIEEVINDRADEI